MRLRNGAQNSMLKIIVLAVVGALFLLIVGLLVAFPLAHVWGFKIFRKRHGRF